MGYNKLAKIRRKFPRNLAFFGDKFTIHCAAELSPPKERKVTSPTLKADAFSQNISYIESSPKNCRQTFLEVISGPFR